MVFLTPNENFSLASGIINTPFLENIYQSFMAEAFIDLGRTITLHLQPQIQQDVPTQSQNQPSQYNPFFGRVPLPQTNTRNTGTKLVHRDVQYKAQIKIGPMVMGDDYLGIGDLKANEAVVTLDIGALAHLGETLSISIEGRRYSITETRPIGFSSRRFIMVKMSEIQELDQALGENEG